MIRPGSTPVIRAAVRALSGTFASEPLARAGRRRGVMLWPGSDAGEVRRRQRGRWTCSSSTGVPRACTLATATTRVAEAGKGWLVVGGALDRAPARPVRLDQNHVGERGQLADPFGVDATHPVLGEHPGAGHDRR